MVLAIAAKQSETGRNGLIQAHGPISSRDGRLTSGPLGQSVRKLGPFGCGKDSAAAAPRMAHLFSMQRWHGLAPGERLGQCHTFVGEEEEGPVARRGPPVSPRNRQSEGRGASRFAGSQPVVRFSGLVAEAKQQRSCNSFVPARLASEICAPGQACHLRTIVDVCTCTSSSASSDTKPRLPNAVMPGRAPPFVAPRNNHRRYARIRAWRRLQ